MKQVPLSRLESQIIKPGFEEHLKPLLRFKGNVTLGRAHRMWNLMISAMEHEATHSDITQRLLLNADYSQLCVPENKITMMGLRGFTGRLLAFPNVMREAAHLEEYVRHLFPSYNGALPLVPWREPPPEFLECGKGKSLLWAAEEFGADYRIVRRWFEEAGWSPVHGGRIPLPKQWAHFAPKEHNFELAKRFGVSVGTVARWRSETGTVCLAPRRHQVAEGTIVYPFVIHDGGKPEHALLRKVNAAVPKHFDPETRADICQDLVVGILCGDFSEDDLGLPAKEMTARVFKMFPTKYGPMSIDAEVPGTDGFRLIDALSEEDGLWARM